jgi:hypothetical protein
MTKQHDTQAHKFPDRLWAELALVAALVAIVITMTTKYVW